MWTRPLLLSARGRHFFLISAVLSPFLSISVIFLHSALIFGSFFAYFTVEIFLFLEYNINLTGKVAFVC